MTTAILYHKGCPDGFGAAWAAYQNPRLERALFVPVQYGEGVPELPDEVQALYILDFSFSREEMLGLQTRYGIDNVLLFDHHKTALEQLDGLLNCHLDMERSGAVLSWKHFHPGTTVPMLMQYVEDRDLWNWKLPDSHAVNLYIQAHEFSFPKWNELWKKLEYGPSRKSVVEAGRAIENFQQQRIEQAIKHARTVRMFDRAAVIVNSSLLQSDIGASLLREYPDVEFAGIYYEAEDGNRRWSLRSRGDTDVSLLAKSRGGGGHKAAAGFVEPLG